MFRYTLGDYKRPNHRSEVGVKIDVTLEEAATLYSALRYAVDRLDGVISDDRIENLILLASKIDNQRTYAVLGCRCSEVSDE